MRFQEQPESSDARQEYESLTLAIEDFASDVAKQHRQHINCRRGCFLCCVPPETLFRIEGELVRDAVGGLSEEQRERIRERVEDSERTLCPLLEDGACSIYESRPMICRTQGLPLAQQNGDEAFELDYCRLNFVTVPQDFELERRHILNLDGTNEILARINLKLVNAAGLDPEQDGRVCFAKAAVGRMVGVPTPVSEEAASAQGPQPSSGGAMV